MIVVAGFKFYDARRGCNRAPRKTRRGVVRGITGTAEATIAGAADFMGGTFSVTQSDLGADDFKPSRACKIAFCTAG
jgi:hypothetical protein